MSAPGTTPGPWQVAGARHSGDLRLGRNTRLHAVGPDNDAVAMVFFDMKTAKGFADAKLIAASPALYNALVEACDEIESLRRYANNHGGMIDEERFVEGLAALKLARGDA